MSCARIFQFFQQKQRGSSEATQCSELLGVRRRQQHTNDEALPENLRVKVTQQHNE